MNINVPKSQCKYINVVNDNPHSPLPPHTSICMLDRSINTPIAIRQRLHTFDFDLLFIVACYLDVYILFLPRFNNRDDNDIGKGD